MISYLIIIEKDIKGIMTNARFVQFNKRFNTNLTYYNEKDRHEYPKQETNNNSSSRTAIKVFTGEDCIHQMFKYIGEHNNNREITIIGHNSLDFDSYLVAQQFKLEKAPPISSSKILSLTIENLCTPVASMRKWKNKDKSNKRHLYIFSDEKRNVREIKKNDDLIRFRNGMNHDTLSSLDIQKIVKVGGRFIKIYEGIVSYLQW